jgi:hypothetical protein
MEGLSSNSSDKKSFPETVKRVDAFYKEIKENYVGFGLSTPKYRRFD